MIMLANKYTRNTETIDSTGGIFGRHVKVTPAVHQRGDHVEGSLVIAKGWRVDAAGRGDGSQLELAVAPADEAQRPIEGPGAVGGAAGPPLDHGRHLGGERLPLRAAAFLQRLGLEWTFRLLQEPSRIRRIYNATTKFPLTILKEELKK